MSHGVTIYNADGMVLKKNVSFQHAIGMLIREVADPYEWIEGKSFGPYPFVTSVILKAAKYIYPKWYDNPAPWSPVAMKIRDRYVCAYCLKHCTKADATVEHIVPQSFGGPTNFMNCVTACKSCNGKKRNRTPEQAGMPIHPGHEPWIPTLRDLDNWKRHGR